MRHLPNIFKNLNRTSFGRFSRDGAKGQFLHYLYPFSIIFCPFFLCFICGTLKMALNSIFLFYLYLFLIILFFVLYINENWGINKWRHLSKVFRNLNRTSFRRFSRDGAKSQFLHYFYPFLLSSVLSSCVSFAALWRWRWIQYFYSISVLFLSLTFLVLLVLRI